MQLNVLNHSLDPELGGALIDAAGKPAFGSLILEAARRIDSVEEFFAFRIYEGAQPRVLHSASVLPDHLERAGTYIDRFHRHDPAALARRNTPIGRNFAEYVRTEQITPHDYRRICFEKPHFIDKLCIGWRGTKETFVLSFYRVDDGGAAALRELSGLGQFCLAALVHKFPGVQSVDQSFIGRLEMRLSGMFSILTAREVQVVARSIAGWSSKRIGRALGIAASTVITYRKRAYQRCGFSKSSDFLPLLLD